MSSGRAFHLGEDYVDALADGRSPELPLSELGEGILEDVLDDALTGDCSWLPPLSDSKLNRGFASRATEGAEETFLCSVAR